MKNYPEVQSLPWSEDEESIEDVMKFTGPAPEVKTMCVPTAGLARPGGGGQSSRARGSCGMTACMKPAVHMESSRAHQSAILLHGI